MDQTELPSRAGNAELMPQMLRLPAVLKVTGLGRSTVYRMVAEHTFPAPVKLAKRAVGWRTVSRPARP
jgi:prophage regulatory protein